MLLAPWDPRSVDLGPRGKRKFTGISGINSGIFRNKFPEYDTGHSGMRHCFCKMQLASNAGEWRSYVNYVAGCFLFPEGPKVRGRWVPGCVTCGGRGNGVMLDTSCLVPLCIAHTPNKTKRSLSCSHSIRFRSV